MEKSITIIGGADGPTSIFLAGKADNGWFNMLGFILMILLMIPNIMYAIKYKGQDNRCTNKAMNLIEQIGRYGSMFLMVFNIGILEYGYMSIKEYLVCLIGSSILMVCYWMSWITYLKKTTFFISMVLAILPTLLFLLNGIMLRHYLLIASSMIFGFGHIYVTFQNAKELK